MSGNGILFALLVLAVASFFVWRFFDQRARRDQFIKEMNACIDGHKGVLASKFNRSVYKTEYGDYNYDSWHAEVDDYIDIYLAPLARRFGQNPVKGILFDAIDNAVRLEIDNNQKKYKHDVVEQDGESLEFYCAERLEALGWHVVKTPKGKDQGVDLIANKEGLVAVVQCKNYAGAVGNKAVQEISAGRAFYSGGAGAAVVVSSNGFTTSARQLASATNVVLLTLDDLEDFDSLVS